MEGEPLVSHILQRFSGYDIELIWAHQERKRFQRLFSSFKRVTADFSLDTTHGSMQHRCFLANFSFVRTSVTKCRVSNKFLKCPVNTVLFLGYL